MGGKRFQPKANALVAMILAVVILFGCVAGAILLSLQRAPTVNDQTVAGAENETVENEYNGAVAEVSDNVIILTEEQAAKVNGSIDSVRMTNQGLYLEIADGTALEDLGIGDIFFLNGSKDTPLGEPYFGKITAKTDRGATDMYCIEAPMIDEVFDKFDIEHTESLNAGNVSEIKTVEGVTVQMAESLDGYFSEAAQVSGAPTDLALTQGNGEAVFLGDGIDQSKEDAFVFECNIDILKAFGLTEDDDNKGKESYVVQEAERIIVYVADQGTRYHRENCQYVKQSKTKMTLAQAVKEYEACKRCSPPSVEKDDGTLTDEASVKFEGKIGIENLDYTVDYDWDIESGKGLQDLSVTATGTFVAEASLKAYAELELGGRTTTVTLPGNCLKLEGLKEKMFPFAFIGYNGSVSVAMGNEQIRAQTSAVPITIAFIFYADLSGKIEVGAEVFFNYSKDLSYSHTFIQNGAFVSSGEFDAGTPDVTFGFKAEASGDVDFHVGASVGLYVFNLNVIDFALAKVGVEAQGTATVALTNKTVPTGNKIFDYDFYMRGYLKLFELRVNINVSFDIWVIEGGLNYRTTFTAYDHTLFQLGKRNPTRYDSGTMAYTNVTARDRNAIYYMDTDGKLVREVDGKKSPLYSEEFFSICGIDESFVYITVKNDSGKLDVYRISKDGSNGERRILDDIKICLATDEQYIYYLSSFDDSVVNRLDRNDLTVSVFADFEETVNFMGKVNDGFYIAVGNADILSILFGVTLDYYLVDSEGEIIKEYGSSPAISDYYTVDKGDYYYASKIQSSGYLHNTAAEVYWLSEDKTASVLTDCTVGWNGLAAGIFTTLRNDTEEEGSFKIVLYQASDGTCVDVTAVDNSHSLFTLCQTESGDWYFFDQDSEGLTLYSMDVNFQNKTAVKSFSYDEFPCDLEDCSMVLLENRLYFYTMSDNLTSSVLYRYDLT